MGGGKQIIKHTHQITDLIIYDWTKQNRSLRLHESEQKAWVNDHDNNIKALLLPWQHSYLKAMYPVSNGPGVVNMRLLEAQDKTSVSVTGCTCKVDCSSICIQYSH